MFCVLGGGILLITGTQLPRCVRQALRQKNHRPESDT
jgi:hypothetical protein